jgi:hypothetical protein
MKLKLTNNNYCRKLMFLLSNVQKGRKNKRLFCGWPISSIKKISSGKKEEDFIVGNITPVCERPLGQNCNY